MSAIYILNLIFTAYTFLLLIRVIGSWFPRLAYSSFMKLVGKVTDPYLNLFRRIIPPIGPIDISPMVAFFSLQIIQYILFAIIK